MFRFAAALVVFAFFVLGRTGAFAQDNVPATTGVAPSPMAPQYLLKKSLRDVSRGSIQSAVKDDVRALQRGPLLLHGNYCGIGNRPGKPPIDELDAACMRHDACTRTGALPSCACDDRLRIEAKAIAEDPRTPPDIQAVAAATETGMALLICKTSPKNRGSDGGAATPPQ